jgi:hypothetical protein
MKKHLLLFAFAIVAVLAFVGCEADPSSSNWLKRTNWEADVNGKECEGFASGTIREGGVRISFSGNGYTMFYDFSVGKSVSSGKVISESFPDYNDAELYLPFDYVDETGQKQQIISTGKISADHKTIHFDSLIIDNSPERGMTFIKDVSFVR